MKKSRARWERPDFQEHPLGAEVTAYLTAPARDSQALKRQRSSHRLSAHRAAACRRRRALSRQTSLPPAARRGNARPRRGASLGGKSLLLPKADPGEGRGDSRQPAVGGASAGMDLTHRRSRRQGRREGGTASWLELARAVGLDEGYVRSERGVAPGTRFAVDAYVTFARTRPWIEAVASSLTELFGPPVMERRVAAIVEKYPWIDPAGLAYFERRIVLAKRDAGSALAWVLARGHDAGDRRTLRRGVALQVRRSVVHPRRYRAGVRRLQMNAQSRPRFGKGVKLRHEPDGGAMLLVPEGALVLNRSAAVALELVDGKANHRGDRRRGRRAIRRRARARARGS